MSAMFVGDNWQCQKGVS